MKPLKNVIDQVEFTELTEDEVLQINGAASAVSSTAASVYPEVENDPPVP
jgi:hypothetical protein